MRRAAVGYPRRWAGAGGGERRRAQCTCLSTRVRHLRTISASRARRSSVVRLLSVYLASRVWPCLLTSSRNLIVMPFARCWVSWDGDNNGLAAREVRPCGHRAASAAALPAAPLSVGVSRGGAFAIPLFRHTLEDCRGCYLSVRQNPDQIERPTACHMYYRHHATAPHRLPAVLIRLLACQISFATSIPCLFVGGVGGVLRGRASPSSDATRSAAQRRRRHPICSHHASCPSPSSQGTIREVAEGLGAASPCSTGDCSQ